jgi:hypothetical protein
MPKPRQAVPGFFWMRGNRGDWQLCRDGATEACIWCGISHPRWLTWAHIHKEDLLLSPDQDWRRVFRLCWRESHGAYAHYQLTTKELLAAEEVWINNPSKRPQPHQRDIELMQREILGCEWTGGLWELPPLLARMRQG